MDRGAVMKTVLAAVLGAASVQAATTLEYVFEQSDELTVTVQVTAKGKLMEGGEDCVKLLAPPRPNGGPYPDKTGLKYLSLNDAQSACATPTGVDELEFSYQLTQNTTFLDETKDGPLPEADQPTTRTQVFLPYVRSDVSTSRARACTSSPPNHSLSPALAPPERAMTIVVSWRPAVLELHHDEHLGRPHHPGGRGGELQAAPRPGARH